MNLPKRAPSFLKRKKKDGSPVQEAKKVFKELMVQNGLFLGFGLKPETAGGGLAYRRWETG